MSTPEVTKSASAFRLAYQVRVEINAEARVVWGRLTDAAAFPTWNSTVTRIEGAIAAGQRLRIEVPSAPGRVFSPTVVSLVPERSMVWRDGFAPLFRGTRTFTLTPANGAVTFEMREVFEGLMLPAIRRSLPDFAPVFAQYAGDLAQACVESGR